MRNAKDRTEVVKQDFGPLKRMCCVFGCPELGSISPSNVGPASEAQWFCRFHFGESSDKWPEITRLRIRANDNPPSVQVETKVDVTPEYIAQVREELRRFAKSFGRITDHKAWAKRLKAREEAGELMSDVQRNGWREALRHEEPA